MENTLNLNEANLIELDSSEQNQIQGGFLPLAVIGGIWVFQIAVAAIALGMKARLDQEK